MVDQPRSSSPFHAGEIALQKRAGVRDRVKVLGQRMIRDHLTDQHQEFFAKLPSLIVGSRDAAGRLWASLLSGEPSFMHAPDPYSLSLASRAVAGDPLQKNLQVGSRLGLLGIQLDTRRRNRASAHVTASSPEEILLGIDQTFGNCPQYIQSRSLERRDAKAGKPIIAATLSHADNKLISNTDTFFIATGIQGDDKDPRVGQDVSHRGGRRGFVKVEDNLISWPDFRGNGHFNSLGNLSVDPRAGLLFIDFESGDSLQLTGRAEVIWDAAELAAYDGAERFLQFKLEQAIRIPNALPFRWVFNGASPVNKHTGIWAEIRNK